MLLKAYRREHVKKMLDGDQFSIELFAVVRLFPTPKSAFYPLEA